MSAIFGNIRFDGNPVERPSLEAMQSALAAHGADGGLWLEGSAGLGHRLMRFTPQDVYERQPLVSDDGAIVLVADARLDNRAELLRDCKLEIGDWVSGQPISNLQSPISTPPDSALILHAYQRWGEACVQHLVGVYAFALWDARAQRLFAARSPIVAPSLYYTTRPGRFAFATAPRGLHALPDLPRALDDTGLLRWLTGLGGDARTTLYRGVNALPSGHWLRASRAGVETGCFWQPDLDREQRFASDDECLEAFNALFERVVADHLASTTPVALQLSGGLDSSAIAAVAAAQLGERGARLAAYTEVPRAGFDGAQPRGMYADETPLVTAIAGMVDHLDLNLVRTDGDFFLDDLPGMFEHLEAPFRNNANRVWIEAILRTAGARGQRVLLDGMQGNLTLSWHGSGWLASLLGAGQWNEAARQVQGMARTRGWPRAGRALIGQGVLPLLPDAWWLGLNRLRHPRQDAGQALLAASPINPAFAAAHGAPDLAHERSNAVRARLRANTRPLRYEALATQDSGAYLSAYRAMVGVDMRSPTADVRLAEFCLALPEDQFWRDGESRRLIRRAMAGRLPPAVLDNNQRGMQAADWFERLVAARTQVDAELARLERSAKAQRVLDLPLLRALYDRLPANAAGATGDFVPYIYVLQGGLMLGAFLRWFEEGA